jgi:xanthine dehydrogenase YagT iron-sulfur-binding subunit
MPYPTISDDVLDRIDEIVPPGTTPAPSTRPTCPRPSTNPNCAAARSASGPRPDTHDGGKLMSLTVNGSVVPLPDDPRVSLLDFLREHLRLPGTKKGCDQGACGACTVSRDGERILACLALAVQCEGGEITTIEGLGKPGALHRLQQAFIEHDGFQCGYCTPGQICSAIAMAEELRRAAPSYVTSDLAAGSIALDRDELRERMSGNICRCGAYNGIAEAILSTFGGDGE